MALLRVAPSTGGPEEGDYLPCLLPAGTRVLRLFNKADYDANGFAYTGFKPTAWKEDAGSTERARWDGLIGSPVGVSYVATPADSDRAVVFEVFSQFIDPLSWSRGLILMESRIRGYAFIELRLMVDIELIDVTTAKGASYFHADISVLQSRERDTTRGWSRLMRRCNPMADGITYTSTAFGDSTGGQVHVLFSPPRDANTLEVVDGPYPVDEPEGRLRLSEALMGSRIELG